MAGETREAEYWVPQPLWPGETVFVLAGGPSLAGFDIERLRGRRIAAVNVACRLARPIAGPRDLLYFTDNHLWERFRDEFEAWPGPVFTASRRAKREAPDRVERLELFECAAFYPTKVRNGRSSGHIVISALVAGGARRIVLLGYDMRLQGERSHFHGEYSRPAHPAVYAEEFLPAFKGWHADAQKVGVEIVNATPGSALMEFPMVDLADELR